MGRGGEGRGERGGEGRGGEGRGGEGRGGEGRGGREGGHFQCMSTTKFSLAPNTCMSNVLRYHL